MSFDYAAIATIADTIIANFGVPVTVTTKGTPVYNVDTGTVVAPTTTETANGVVTNYDSKDIDGSVILRGDKRLLLSPIGITAIKPNATISVLTVTYTVVAVNEINPAGVSLVYDLQIRGV